MYKDIEQCPVCGHANKFWNFKMTFGPKFLTPEGFEAAFIENYVQCPICSFIFQNPQPDMSEFYSGGQYRKYMGSQTQEQLDANEKARAENIWKFIESEKLNTGNLLDVGSSRGYLLDLAAEGNLFCYGIEPNFHYSTSKESVVESFSRITDGFYSLVTCIHVLEHVPDPLPFVLEMKSKLDLGGKLLIEVPTLPGSPFRLAHLGVYTPPSIKTLMTRAGLVVEKMLIGDNIRLIARPE